MAHIRTKAELYALTLTPAEVQLIDACQKGEPCILGDGSLPAKGTPDPQRHIHASVLRYLILGGCENCRTDDIGVRVIGAHVTQTLNLDFTTTRGAIQMPNSRFEERFYCEQTKCQQLQLDGSYLQGILGQGLVVTGNVFLRNITTLATIDVNNATIGSQLDCSDAKFVMSKGDALNVFGAKVAADVFITNITTHAKIDISGATIGGQLDCSDATFEMTEDYALYAQGAKVIQAFIWRGITIARGHLNFNTAHFGVLADDEQSWPKKAFIRFDGMTYDRIVGAATDAKTRLKWLEKGHKNHSEFQPQPYTQLAKVLRDMGHDSDARLVLEERDAQIHQNYRKKLQIIKDPTKNNRVSRCVLKLLSASHKLFIDKLMRTLTGYGHQPFRSLRFLILLIGLAAIPSHVAWTFGGFTPNSAVIQVSDDWKKLSDLQNPAKVWSSDTEAGRDWETFQAVAYAIDLVIPIINIGQTDAWAPSTTRGAAGYHMWWLSWVFTIVGWIVTALGAAAITGMIKRD